METITLKINNRSKAGKALKDLIDVLSGKPNTGVEIVEEKSRYNAKTEKVIADAKKGIGVNRVKNSEELFKALGI